MKYMCLGKELSDGVGIGNTIEEAWADLEGEGNAYLKDAKWYALTPINVKLSVDNTKPTNKKEIK